jgi:hypothetical protein
MKCFYSLFQHSKERKKERKKENKRERRKKERKKERKIIYIQYSTFIFIMDTEV